LQKYRTFEKNSFFAKNSCTKLFITKKFLTDCKNPTYFFREFSLATIQISSQSVKIYLSYAASKFEKYGFKKYAFKVLSDIIFYL